MPPPYIRSTPLVDYDCICPIRYEPHSRGWMHTGLCWTYNQGLKEKKRQEPETQGVGWVDGEAQLVRAYLERCEELADEGERAQLIVDALFAAIEEGEKGEARHG